MLLALLLLGCPGEVAQPTVTILSPAPEATVGTEVTVEVAVDGFELVAQEASLLRWLVPTAYAHEPGDDPQGYVRLTLDEVEVASGPQTTFSLEDLAAGDHVLVAELFWPDGDAFYPAVDDEVSFTVAP